MKMTLRKLSFTECAMITVSLAATVHLGISQNTTQPVPVSTSALSPTPVVTPTISPTLVVTPATSSPPVVTPTISPTPVVTPTISPTPVVTPTISSTPVVTPATSSPPVVIPTISPTPATMSPLVVCPEETDQDWGYTWNTTSGGTRVVQMCSNSANNTVGYVSRDCSNNGKWSAVNVSECQNVLISISTAQILNIAQSPNLTDEDRGMLQNASAQLSEATGGTLFPTDLEEANRALQAVASLGVSALEGNILLVDTILNISSNVLEDRNTPAWSTLANMSSTTGPSLLLESVEQFTANVGQFVASQQQGELNINAPNVVLSVNTVNMSDTMIDVSIDVSNLVTNMSLIQRMQAPAITLPSDFLAERFASAGMTQRLPITTVVIRNLQNYLPAVVLNTTRVSGSLILSSQVGTEVGFSDALLRRPVTIQFPVIVENGRNPLCVFWNFTLNSWSDVGLTEGTIVESHRGVLEVQCLTTHLTSFAILMDVSGTLPPSVPLSVLTYIGCGISIVCLILTMIFLVSLRRELYQQVNYFVLLNLCIALTCGLIVFCAGIETATPNLVACSIVTVLLHYFFLAAFSWMLCQAVVIYNLLVRVYGAHKRPWLYLYLALGWGIPIPIVVLSVGIRYNYYHIRGSLDVSDPAYSTTRACWLSSEFGVIFAFVVPILAIIMVNSVLLGLSLRSLWKSDLGSSVQNIDSKAHSNSFKLARKLIKATVILLPLLGLTWIFGLLSAIPIPHPGQVILSTFFLILNTLQGVFIFWFHVVRSDKVWGWLKDKCFSKCSTIKWKSGETKSSNNNTASNQMDTLELPKSGTPLSNYKTNDILYFFPQDSMCEVEGNSNAETSLMLQSPSMFHAVSMEFQEIEVNFSDDQ